MNSSKTEFILLWIIATTSKCECNCINVCGEIAPRSDSIHLLGARLDRILSFKVHITNKCKLAIFNVQWIKSIHRYLSLNACKTLILLLVVLHLDYVNSLLCRVSDCEIKKMQIVKNLAAKLTLSRSKYDSGSGSASCSQCYQSRKNWVQNSDTTVQQPGSQVWSCISKNF